MKASNTILFSMLLPALLWGGASAENASEHLPSNRLYAQLQDNGLKDNGVFSAHHADDDGTDENLSMQDIVFSYKGNLSRLRQAFNDTIPFLGFYFTADYAQYLQKNYTYRNDTSYEYQLALRWNLFDKGYTASKKMLGRIRNEDEITSLQLLSQMLDSAYQTQLSAVQNIDIAIHARYYNELSDAYAHLLKQQKRQLEGGFLTIDTFEETEASAARVKIQKSFFDKARSSHYDAHLYQVLNQVDGIALRNRHEVQRLASENDIDVQLQNNLAQRADYLPEYTDKLKVNFYTQYRDVDNVGSYDTVGIYADIPLQYDDERAKIIRLKSDNYRLRKAALKKMLAQDIDALYYQFNYQQTQLALKKSDLHYLALRIARLEKHAGAPVDISRASLPQLQIERIRTAYEAMEARVALLRILIQLKHLGNTNSLNQLIVTGNAP